MPIQPVSPDCSRLVDLASDIEWLAEGLGAEGGGYGFAWLPAEGPVWMHEDGCLLLSDIGKSQRLKWSPGEGVTVVATDNNQANGMTRDLEGRLVICEHLGQRVVRIERDGRTTVVVDRHAGKRLSRPNDVVVKSDGSVYFTDPNAPVFTQVEVDYAGVYRCAPDGTTALLAKDLVAPNGLCFSPGESILYVNDTHTGTIYAYEVLENGLVGDRRTFCILKDDRLGLVDGMKTDREGNLYCTGPGGIWMLDPAGRQFGTIPISDGLRATNLAWGEADWRTLFITTQKKLGRIRMKIPGCPVPAAG